VTRRGASRRASAEKNAEHGAEKNAEEGAELTPLTPSDVEGALATPRAHPYDVRAVLLPEARDGAVIVPLSFGPLGATVHVALRSAHLREHGGELGFPGGKVEPGEQHEAAALRELEEEVGVSPSEARVLGPLLPMPVVTRRFLIHPFVAAVPGPLRSTSPEIDALFELPLARWLTARETIEVTLATWRGLDLTVPHFAVGPHLLYGASAAILFDLLCRLSPEPLPLRVVERAAWTERYRGHD
jgi:8-oxo-dGTP pyrophosphatase MutT (NUDIX family)